MVHLVHSSLILYALNSLIIGQEQFAIRRHLFYTSRVDTYGYGSFQNKISNGMSVPNLCNSNPNNVWAGVGHQASADSNLRIPFGVGFASTGRSWKITLCQMDSDGDGKANVEELGHPDCL
ncbi:Temptin [Trichoplax sp. H2]|nr:Temptin [Trichoplax sp. H2]|eukprot:RDD37777.1 Temptin [Trichoplax sp. H2]